VDGWKRLLAAPSVLAGVIVFTIMSAIPPAVVMREALAAQLDGSLVAEDVAHGVNYDWWQEFLSQASGISRTFSPRIVGFAAVLDSLSGVVDTRAEITPLAMMLVIHVLLWTAFSAGIIDRYARQRATGARGAAAACGAHARGFLLLALCGGLAYGWILGYVHPWLLDTRYASLTRNVDSERIAFAWRVAGYAIVGLLVSGTNLILDYAKIRMVVEDRRSAVGSLVTSLRFVSRNAASVVGLYFVNAAICAAVLAAWAVMAPRPQPAGIRAWLAFAIGEAFVVARLALKLHFLASQTALFQRSLAHERFIAAPLHRRPDAPVVEALGGPAAGGHVSI
jgi:hypothetical protein